MAVFLLQKLLDSIFYLLLHLGIAFHRHTLQQILLGIPGKMNIHETKIALLLTVLGWGFPQALGKVLTNAQRAL
jgi:hypothetical protein